MRFITRILTAVSIAAAAITTSAGIAHAQVEGEDVASLDSTFAAIMEQMPSEGDLIMVPFASNLDAAGAVESAELIDDESVPGRKAFRVTAKKGQNNWDATVTAPVGPAVNENDLLVMVYYARIVEGDPSLPYNVIQMNSSPYAAAIRGSANLTEEWVPYVASGRVERDYGQNSLQVIMQLANADHTIDFGPVFVLNLGQPAAE